MLVKAWLENDLSFGRENFHFLQIYFSGFPVLGNGFGGRLGEDLVVRTGGAGVAAVEVDSVGGEAAVRRCLLACAEAERSVEAGEGDVWVVCAVFRGEPAAGHGDNYLCLELEERAGGFDFCDEDACSWEGVQAGEF